MNLTASEWGKYLQNVIWIDDIPWEIRNNTLLPIAMPHTIKNLDRKKINEAVNSTKSLLAAWTDDWDSKESEWWWTLCDDKNYNINLIKHSASKRGVKKGLKNCTVRRIEFNSFADSIYKIFFKAHLSYNIPISRIISYENYHKEIKHQNEYAGFELWGVFSDETLVGFATCILMDNAVLIGSSKSDPNFHHLYPNNTLYYSITKHYLTERGSQYITNGPRTLLHTTTINEFLIRMGFKKVYARINIELANNAKLINRLEIGRLMQRLKFLQHFFPQQYNKIIAFNNLIGISRSFKSND